MKIGKTEIFSEAGKSKRRQLTDYFRARISSGLIVPGSILPSTQELSKELGTTVSNVHRALSFLAKEGLVRRCARIGTVVTGTRTLGKAVIVVFPDENGGVTSYIRLLQECLRKELSKRGIASLVFLFPDGDGGLSVLENLIRNGGAQGILLLNRPENRKLLREILSLPAAVVRPAGTGACSLRELFRMAAEEFRRLGVSRIGMITAYPEGPMEIFREAGLEVRPEWVGILPGKFKTLRGTEWEMEYSRRAFREIWSAKEKPEGLFVSPDDLLPGTLFGILGERVRVPEELRLVLQRNSEFPEFCPVPASFLESSAAETAGQYADSLVKLFHGEKPEPFRTVFHLKTQKKR